MEERNTQSKFDKKKSKWFDVFISELLLENTEMSLRLELYMCLRFLEKK